jgi:hypothetical protein
MTMDEVIIEIQSRARSTLPTNFHFLQSSSIILSGTESDERFRILGTTLWTHVSPEGMDVVENCISDYKFIHTPTGLLRVTDTNRMHHMERTWLKDELDRDREIPTIVITHHLPTSKLCNPRYLSATDERTSLLNQAFFTDFVDEEFIKARPNLKLWIAGHSHSPMVTKIADCIFVLNPFY